MSKTKPTEIERLYDLAFSIEPHFLREETEYVAESMASVFGAHCQLLRRDHDQLLAEDIPLREIYR